MVVLASGLVKHIVGGELSGGFDTIQSSSSADQAIDLNIYEGGFPVGSAR